MKGRRWVWVVGDPEPRVDEVLSRTDLGVRWSSVWRDLEDGAPSPDAIILTGEREPRGFERVVERYAEVPLVMIDESEPVPHHDLHDRSLVLSSRHAEAILSFLGAELGFDIEPVPTRRHRLPALIRADGASFVGRTVGFSEHGVSVTAPGLRAGLTEVEVALVTAGPCLRFEARVERLLRSEGETHLGLVWKNLSPVEVQRLLEALDGPDPRALADGPQPGDPGCLDERPEAELPDWVERALTGLAYVGAWNHRVLKGRIETAIQLSSPAAGDLLLPTGDL